MKPDVQQRLTAEQLARIEATAPMDRRTLARALAGYPIRPLSRERLRRAVAELGIPADVLPAPRVAR
ncbi:MAG TPA: hypothetical protein VKB92_13345 [Myxococcales bacterium]|nr:hypothetical protein [Myxococcales bacterium]